MITLLSTFSPDILADTLNSLLPWQKVLVGVVAAFIIYKIVAFQIGMLIKLILFLAVLAGAAYFIIGTQ